MSKKITNEDIIYYLAETPIKKRIRIIRAARHLRKAFKLSNCLKSKDELLDEAVKELGA